MAKIPKSVVTAQDVVTALKAKYDSNGYAFFEQVNNATGWRGNRAFTDAVVVSLWPSRGIEAYGFEIKVSRADWRKELAKPAKAELVQKYCTRWWVVSGNNCVPESEVPPKWGLLELRGKGLHIVKNAPLLKPKPLDLPFVASLVRRAHEVSGALVANAYERGRAEGEAQGPEAHHSQVLNLNKKIASLERGIADFEAASGVKLSAYDGEYLGKMFKQLLQHRRALGRGEGSRAPEILDQAATQLHHLSEAAKRAADQAREQLALMNEAISTKDTGT